jgi:ERCC4-related helicase
MKYYNIVNQLIHSNKYYISVTKEAIKNNDQNCIINLPTGTGKNIIIIHSLISNKKYLILVPYIILMEKK